MCVQLGLETALLAKLGDDQFGENYLRYLKTAGMDTRHVTIQKNCQTSASIITVADTGENTIVYYPGAADALVEDDVERAEDLFRGAKVCGRNRSMTPDKTELHFAIALLDLPADLVSIRMNLCFRCLLQFSRLDFATSAKRSKSRKDTVSSPT